MNARDTAGEVPLSVKVVHGGGEAVTVALYVDADGPGGKPALEVARFDHGSFDTTVLYYKELR